MHARFQCLASERRELLDPARRVSRIRPAIPILRSVAPRVTIAANPMDPRCRRSAAQHSQATQPSPRLPSFALVPCSAELTAAGR